MHLKAEHLQMLALVYRVYENFKATNWVLKTDVILQLCYNLTVPSKGYLGSLNLDAKKNKISFLS